MPAKMLQFVIMAQFFLRSVWGRGETPFSIRCRIIFLLGFVCLFCSITLGQDANGKLIQQVIDLVLIVESDKEKDGNKSAAQYFNRLKVAANCKRPDLVESLNEDINKENFGKHYNAVSVLLRQISKETAKEGERLRLNWKSQVDALVRKTEEACMNDLPSTELEKLLAEEAGVRLNKPIETVASATWLEMTSNKLDSALGLLVSWIDYKRLKEKKFDKRAAYELSNILNSSFSVPILSREFLDSQMPKVKAPAVATRKIMLKPSRIQAQQKILTSLNSQDLNSKNLAKASEQFDALPVQAEDRIAESIWVLRECLAHVESRHFSAARDRLSLFCRLSDEISMMVAYRSKVASDLTPVLYSEIKAKPRNPDQNIRLYLFDLIGEPSSMEDVAIMSDLIHFYGDFAGKKRDTVSGIQWIESSRKQYLYLLRAKSAMDGKAYARALESFHNALGYSVDAMPAGAGNFIVSQIEGLKLVAPKLFDTDASSYLKEIATLKKRISALELELHNKPDK